VRTICAKSQNKPGASRFQRYEEPPASLLRSRHELLDNDNLGVTFGNDEDRVILRPSHARIATQYANWIREDLLRLENSPRTHMNNGQPRIASRSSSWHVTIC